MSPDVAAAIVRLEKRGVLSPTQTSLVARVARGELVSVRPELRFLLYGGVVLTMAGVGLLLQQNLERIGPVAIAVILGLGAVGCLLWVAHRAPGFSRKVVTSPHLAFDYLLLLGVLLAAADLAYVESQFTPLGKNWPWHLLMVALLTGALALRFDSRLVFSLALTSFAAPLGPRKGPCRTRPELRRHSRGPHRVAARTRAAVAGWDRDGLRLRGPRLSLRRISAPAGPVPRFYIHVASYRVRQSLRSGYSTAVEATHP